jgi:hypothetical protein
MVVTGAAVVVTGAGAVVTAGAAVVVGAVVVVSPPLPPKRVQEARSVASRRRSRRAVNFIFIECFSNPKCIIYYASIIASCGAVCQ